MFEHLRGYGIDQVGLMRSNGALGDFYVGFDACHDDESRNTRIEGLEKFKEGLEKFKAGAEKVEIMMRQYLHGNAPGDHDSPRS
jgi:hypothetical protein